MDVTLKKLSICPCGFPVLHEDIPLGEEYVINPVLVAGFTFICGGCGRQIQVQCVWVEQHNYSKAGYLPKTIFE